MIALAELSSTAKDTSNSLHLIDQNSAWFYRVVPLAHTPIICREWVTYNFPDGSYFPAPITKDHIQHLLNQKETWQEILKTHCMILNRRSSPTQGIRMSIRGQEHPSFCLSVHKTRSDLLEILKSQGKIRAQRPGLLNFVLFTKIICKSLCPKHSILALFRLHITWVRNHFRESVVSFSLLQDWEPRVLKMGEKKKNLCACSIGIIPHLGYCKIAVFGILPNSPQI